MIDYETIPPRIKTALDAWVDHGHLPGGFLQAVLRNDLSDALARADANSLDAIHSIVGYLYNECPAPCWGSPEKMDAWTHGRVKNPALAR
jgi:hypothetical protein